MALANHSEQSVIFLPKSPEKVKISVISRTSSSVNVAKTDSITKFTSFKNRFGGIALSALSGLMDVISSVIIKRLNNIHPGHFATTNCLFQALFLLPFIIFRKIPFKTQVPSHWIYIFIFSICGGATVHLRFETYQQLPPADAIIIVYSTPVFVAVAARIFLKEPCSSVLVISLLLAMVGLILVVKTSSSQSVDLSGTDPVLGVCCGVASVLTAVPIAIFKAGKLKPYRDSLLLFFGSSVSFIVLASITGFSGWFVLPDPSRYQQWSMMAVDVMSLLSKWFYLESFNYETAGVVNLVRSISCILSSFLMQLLFFGDAPNSYVISGAVLVLISGFLISFKKPIDNWTTNVVTNIRTRFLISV